MTDFVIVVGGFRVALGLITCHSERSVAECRTLFDAPLGMTVKVSQLCEEGILSTNLSTFTIPTEAGIHLRLANALTHPSGGQAPALHREGGGVRHSRGSGNPSAILARVPWTPASAGVTDREVTTMVLMTRSGGQAPALHGEGGGGVRHSRASGNPSAILTRVPWTPASAGVTDRKVPTMVLVTKSGGQAPALHGE